MEVHMNNIYLQQMISIANESKYTKWYNNIITNALNRKALSKVYTEKHHILPKSFDLSCAKYKDNIVKLTAREHFIIHLLTTKMFSGLFATKMNFAFWQMRLKNVHQQERYINSRFYEKQRRQLPRYIRLYKGENVKYISPDDPAQMQLFLADGWVNKMTEEYKIGRVGMMQGKKHTIETKQKMSNKQKGIVKNKGYNHTIEWKQNATNRNLQRHKDHPELAQNTSIRNKQLYALGILNSKGANNPMYGRKRKALYDPITQICRYIDITKNDAEMHHLLQQGWVYGLLRKIKQPPTVLT